MSLLPKIVVIAGPTGVGKTDFAVHLAQKLRAEIVGADSMQIYREMEIGTAKPTPAEREAVRHHMVDIVPPDHSFDAADYAREADRVIQYLHERSILPLVVGGTGLYIKALLLGLFDTPKPDEALRERLRTEARQKGGESLHRRLQNLDPEAAARIHPNDTMRLVRALEIAELTGRPLSQHHAGHGFSRPRFDTLKIGLTLPREILYARIDRRVEQMVADGLEEEVRSLLARGYAPELKSMQALGYRHMVAFLQGRVDRTETERTLKRDHRHYAKRQLTWFKADPEFHWLSPAEAPNALELISTFTKNTIPHSLDR